MALSAVLVPVSDYTTGDLEYTVATLAGWAMTGLIEPELGWLLCNGATIPNTGRYVALYSYLNGNFGGAGVLPTLIDGVQPAAVGPSILTMLGVSRGAINVTLSTAHMPSLAHTWVDEGPDTFDGSFGIANAGDESSDGVTVRSSGSSGGGGSHNNMSPYFVVEGMLIRL